MLICGMDYECNVVEVGVEPNGWTHSRLNVDTVSALQTHGGLGMNIST